MNSSTPALCGREWNGVLIRQRLNNGYVNATAMCRANGKRWENYRRNDRTAHYLQALSRSVGIPTDLLSQTRQGGSPQLQGTWVHPRLAVDLARWISPAFAVWMDGWFLEWMAGRAPASEPTSTSEPIDWVWHAEFLARSVRRVEGRTGGPHTPALIVDAATEIADHYRPISITAQVGPIAALLREASNRLDHVTI